MKRYNEVAIIGECGTGNHIRKIRRALTLTGIVSSDIMIPHDVAILPGKRSKKLTETEKLDILMIAYQQLAYADKLLVVKSNRKDRSINASFIERVIQHAFSLNIPVFTIREGQMPEAATEYKVRFSGSALSKIYK